MQLRGGLEEGCGARAGPLGLTCGPGPMTYPPCQTSQCTFLNPCLPESARWPQLCREEGGGGREQNIGLGLGGSCRGSWGQQ